MKPERINKSKRSGVSKKWLGLIAGTAVMLTNSNLAYAQSGSTSVGSFLSGLDQNGILLLIALGVFMVVAVLLLVVCLYILYFLSVLNAAEQRVATEGTAQEVPAESIWVQLNKKFGSGDLLPVGREKEIMMDHAYDGIHELDNHMPPWLKYLFYATIGFAVVYVMNFLVLGTGKLQIEEYHDELAVAAKVADERKLLAVSGIDETNVVLLSDAATLEGAKALYLQNCAACHGKDGGGTVGPNLTDEYWLHGGSIQDVFKIIKFGVQEKGMIPWQDKLKPEEIQGIASYILSLQGTTPENPKAPQGEKHVEGGADKALTSLD